MDLAHSSYLMKTIKEESILSKIIHGISNSHVQSFSGSIYVLKGKVAHEQNVANTQARDERLTVTLRACVYAHGETCH